jgi:hypothetical protein
LANYMAMSASMSEAQPKPTTYTSEYALANYTRMGAEVAETKAAAEHLGAGWSRNADGTLKYESDLAMQYLVPGTTFLDGARTDLANGDYLGAAVNLAGAVLEDAMFVVTFGASQVRTAATKGATLGVEAAVAQQTAAATSKAVASKPAGNVYSVAAEVRLSPSSYPGVSRGAHAQEANEQLLRAMEADPSLAQTMNSIGVQVNRTATGLAPRSSPTNWTWHHAQDPGTLQLVPREQHAAGSVFQEALHPGGTGGYSIWGRQ